MQKLSACALACLLLVGTTVGVSACSDDDTTSTFQDGTPDAASDASPGFVVGEGGASDAAPDATATCAPNIPDGFKATWLVTARGDGVPCSAADIDGYYSACLASLGTDAGDACATWTAAHAACTTCIEPANLSGPIQWHQNRFFYTLNVAGCIALEQGKFGEQDCGGAYNAAVSCSREACKGCFESGASFEAFRSCQGAASQTGLCKSLETQQASVCQGVQTAEATKSCFKETAETSEVFFKRVIATFCGAP